MSYENLKIALVSIEYTVEVGENGDTVILKLRFNSKDLTFEAMVKEHTHPNGCACQQKLLNQSRSADLATAVRNAVTAHFEKSHPLRIKTDFKIVK